MRRPLAVMAALLVLSGCQATTPTAGPVDPFFGRTRIEPPGTGTVAVPKATDPYYAAPKTSALPPSGGVPSPGNMRTPPPSSPNASASLQASTGSTSGTQATPRRGDVVAIPPPARAAASLVASRTGSVSSGASALPAAPRTAGSVGVVPGSGAAASAGPQKLVQTISPRPKPVEQANQNGATATLPSSWPSPQPVGAPAKAINILDLPAPKPAGGSQSSATAKASGVVPASATEEVDSPAKDGRYGYDSSYQYLRGRLEYSQIDRLWRLRYIPVDGATDAYGGSVALSQTPKLSGFERGDFVEVHGRLVTAQPGSKTFAAGYEISDIKRLGPQG